ncbi:MAG: alpha/beta hydrolase [Sphingobacteriaceae bacterium]|nr:MAG: alpha/beta hydrolase [Sphingobacteriaceae bacterium]
MRFSFTLLLFVWLSFTIKAQVLTKEKKDISELYQEAKIQFINFEKLHGHFIQTKNVKMHYLTWGNPENIPLIWSHGSLLNAYELYDVADKLAKAGYYIIAIDYYGHGLTPIPNHEVSLYNIADDIKFLMDKLKISKAVIGGFSRGGYISSAFYDAYPNYVLGLVLADGGSVSSNTHYHQMDTSAIKNQFKYLDDKTSFPWDSTYTSEFDAYKSLYDQTEKGNQFKTLILIKKNKFGKYGIYEGLNNFFYMNSSQNFSDLIYRPTKAPLFAASMVMMEPKIIYRNLKVPVLILDPISKNDPFPFEKENQALQKQHSDLIKHVTYPNIEHNIIYAEPEKFTEDLIDFLKQVKRYNKIN